MFSELCLILLAIFVGVNAGIITGLTPGVHINLVSVILLGFAPIIAQFAPLHLIAILIVAMSVTHTFLDTLPSIFLGAPDDEKALGVLPGHRYLLQGNGMMAVKLCIVGGIAGSLTSVILFLPATWLLEIFFTWSKPALFWIMLGLVAFTIAKDAKKAWATMVFAISGLFGIIVLRLPLNEPLLPMLSGIFGIATLLYSINENQQIPKQKQLPYTELEKKRTVLATILGWIAGFLTALYPGVSASMASAATSRFGNLGDRGFLILLGSLGSASFLLSLCAYLAIEKARNGAMAVIVALTPMSPGTTTMLLGTGLFATGIAAILTLRMGYSAASWLPRIPYRATCIGVIVFVVGIVALRCGWLGVLVLATSTAVGLLPAGLKTARGQAMGCLLLPILVLLW